MLKLSFTLLMLVTVSAQAVPGHSGETAPESFEPVATQPIKKVEEKFDMNKAIIEGLEKCVQRKGIQTDVHKFLENK